MRRRQPPPSVAEPPARLRVFEPQVWAGLVDPAGYDPNRHRNRLPEGYVGEPRLTCEQWRVQEGYRRWLEARGDWHDLHGWPGGLDRVQLLQEARAMRRGYVRPRDTSARHSGHQTWPSAAS